MMRRLPLAAFAVLGLISSASLAASPQPNTAPSQEQGQEQGSPYDQDAEDYQEEDEDVIILEDDEEESQTTT